MIRQLTIIVIFVGISLSVMAEQLYFKLDNGEIISIDSNTVSAHSNNESKIAILLKRRGNNAIGAGTESDPIFLDTNGHYFGKFISVFLKTNIVHFSTFADAANCLAIAQDLGLYQLEHHILSLSDRVLVPETPIKFHALSPYLTSNKDELIDLATVVIAAARSNDTKTLKTIYKNGLIDVDLLIPATKNGKVYENKKIGLEGSPAISFAAQTGNLEAVELLLKFGANPMIKSIYPENEGCKTPILWAKEGKNKRVKKLIKKAIKTYKTHQ